MLVVSDAVVLDLVTEVVLVAEVVDAVVVVVFVLVVSLTVVVVVVVQLVQHLAVTSSPYVSCAQKPFRAKYSHVNKAPLMSPNPVYTTSSQTPSQVALANNAAQRRRRREEGGNGSKQNRCVSKGKRWEPTLRVTLRCYMACTVAGLRRVQKDAIVRGCTVGHAYAV